MSWSEIKKAINSDLTEPLNYLAWINDLATFGTDSYVYNQPEKMAELAEKSLNAAFNLLSFEFLIDGYADKVFTGLTGDITGAFDGLTTMELIVEDVTAMTAVANSETAMTAIANSETAMTAIANSETALNSIGANTTAMAKMMESAIAITALDNGCKTIPVMTSSTTPSGVVSASSAYSGYDAFKAFDGISSTSNRWASAAGQNTNQWLQYSFPNTVFVYKAKLQIDLAVAGESVKDFKVQYSVDGIEWMDCYSGTFVSGLSKTAEFNLITSGSAKHWRVFAVDGYGAAQISIGEIQFYSREFV